MTGLPWETTGRRVSYTCDGFDVVTEDVRLPDGAAAEFDYVSEPPSVVVLPFTPYGKVVVIEEWRQAVDRLNRGLPAGTLEDGEDPDDAARRELTEETGYEAGELTHLTTVEPANGFSDAVFHYYVARKCEQTGEQALEADESISVDTTELDDLVAAAREGELRDGRTVFGILYYSLFEISSGLPSW
ncbi:NUDIX hydrolase [Halobacteriales archaeon Cl-PHB]